MKILVVDDEQRIRELIGQYLMVEGYDVEYAKDGIDALTKISKGDIDLCILDVMMPFMDGITALREMRSRGFKTPVASSLYIFSSSFFRISIFSSFFCSSSSSC